MYFLKYYTYQQNNRLIVAKSEKAILKTVEYCYEKYGNFTLINYWKGEKREPPAYVDYQKSLREYERKIYKYMSPYFKYFDNCVRRDKEPGPPFILHKKYDEEKYTVGEEFPPEPNPFHFRHLDYDGDMEIESDYRLPYNLKAHFEALNGKPPVKPSKKFEPCYIVSAVGGAGHGNLRVDYVHREDVMVDYVLGEVLFAFSGKECSTENVNSLLVRLKEQEDKALEEKYRLAAIREKEEKQSVKDNFFALLNELQEQGYAE